MELKQSIAFRAPVRLVLTSNGIGKAGLATGDVVVAIQKQADASAVKALGPSDWFEIDAVTMPGVYDVLLSAADTDTLGYLKYSVAALLCDTYFGLLEIRANLEDDTYNRLGAPATTSIAADIATRATQAQILSDATPFPGADIDVTISSRASAVALTAVQADTDDLQTRLPATLNAGRIRSHVEAMAADVIGASQIAAGAIGVSEAPLLANLDVTVSTRAAPGAAMDLVTDAVDANALAASAVAEIQADLATAVALDEVQLGVDQLLSVCVVKQSYAYDPILEQITGQIWVERGNAVITTVTSTTVTWYNENGTALFTITDSAPDAQGVFKVTKTSPGLVRNKSYYAIALVNVPTIGAVVSGKGAMTIG